MLLLHRKLFSEANTLHHIGGPGRLGGTTGHHVACDWSALLADSVANLADWVSVSEESSLLHSVSMHGWLSYVWQGDACMNSWLNQYEGLDVIVSSFNRLTN